jgi:hypothetical protein
MGNEMSSLVSGNDALILSETDIKAIKGRSGLR